MLKVQIRPHWEISFSAEPALDTAALLGLLLAIQDTGSIAQAAKTVQLSYRYAWGLLREAERLFGDRLLETGRGRGTVLTPLAQKLVWADRRIAARLSPTLESLASELENELGKVTQGKLSTIRIDGSHGFAVAALTAHLNSIELPMELRYRNSTDAVAALSRRECDLAGFHVPRGAHEAATAAWYTRWLNDEHSLVNIAGREQGLFVAPGNPLGIRGLADLARPEVRFVNRQAGSGTRMLLEMMLADAGIATDAINSYNNSAEYTHPAVAAYIASGMADVGIGVRTAAERFKLDFIPLVWERYFFALRTDALDEPLMRQLLTVLRQPGYHRQVAALAGYDASETGTIESVHQAFGRRRS
jgi:molybdate transport repressor ModE-like protein